MPDLDPPLEEPDDAELLLGPERRTNQRFRIGNRANIVSWGRKYRARVVDISHTGAALSSRAHLRVGEKALLTVHDMGRYRGTIIRQFGEGEGAAMRFDDKEPRPIFDEAAVPSGAAAIEPTTDKRRFARASTYVSASLITGGERIRGTLLDLSVGGTALETVIKPDIARSVILYIEQLGRMRGRIVRHFAEGVAIEFDIEPSRRDRIAQQVDGLLGQKPA